MARRTAKRTGAKRTDAASQKTPKRRRHPSEPRAKGAAVSTHLIRRYGNRRLYDANLSRAVTLEEIAEFIRHGDEVRVVDADDGTDITKRMLTQIILEQQSKNPMELFPVEMLRQIISLKDGKLDGWLEQYLSAGAKWMEQFSASGASVLDGSIDQLFPWMQQIQQMQRGVAAAAAPKSSEPDLRAELAELQRRMADLTSKVKSR